MTARGEQAAAARDILVKAPAVLAVIREAATQLGCDHKLAGSIGTPVNAAILTRAMHGQVRTVPLAWLSFGVSVCFLAPQSSQFDKLHAAVNAYLEHENIPPYKADRDTVHRLLRFARYAHNSHCCCCGRDA